MFNLNEGGLIIYLFKEGGIFAGNPNVKIWYSAVFIAFTVIVMVSSYLLGSINSAIIVSKLLYNDDVRKHGSGNPGLTNMLRTYGKAGAGLTLLGDMLKCVISIFIAGLLFGFYYIKGVSTGEGLCYIAGLFCVLGHVFPVYYGFKGGKGVLSTATMALMLAPIPALFLIIIFIAIVATSKYVSLGSVSAAVLYPVVLNGYFLIIFKKPPFGLVSLSVIIIAILIVWCHRENLKRIGNRTERKLSIGGKKKDKEGDSEK